MMVFMLMTRFGFCCCNGHVFDKTIGSWLACVRRVMDARETTVSLKTKLFSQSFIHLVSLYFYHNAAKRSFLLLSQAFSSSVFLFPGIKLTLRKRPQGSRNQRASAVLQTCDSQCYSETRSQVSELKSGLFFIPVCPLNGHKIAPQFGQSLVDPTRTEKGLFPR